ncbi:C6 transcription factor [Colletotrichum truncatum]|uniref:C6 transcription factor n=1 Tax=Colletotrichum truncatum TaxID=5467 RepID=A0ACC3YH01_COLTU
MAQWARLWELPMEAPPSWSKEIVFTALAVGARVCPVIGQDGLRLAAYWAHHFSEAIEIPINAMREPSLQLVHLLLLKAMYALHEHRFNDTFFYVGCASRTCIALGLNRAAVIAGPGIKKEQFRLAFWMTYIMERTSALIVGRPSSLRDEDIDTPYPEGSRASSSSTYIEDIPPCGRITDWSFVGIMAKLGHVSDCVMSGIYSVQKVSDARDLLMETNIHGCELALENIKNNLPAYLDFQKLEAPVGTDWQELQRLHIGMVHQFMRMLVHRPALIFTTYFSSISEAQSNIPGSIQLQSSIDISRKSAKGIITLAHESLSTRQPDARSDGSLAIYIIAACITLLYEVLDPATTPLHAKDTFSSVEQAIQCLDGMKHFAPTTGKTLSSDIMQMAKNVLFCSTGFGATDACDEFTAEFPWLRYVIVIFSFLLVLVLPCQSTTSLSSAISYVSSY